MKLYAPALLRTTYGASMARPDDFRSGFDIPDHIRGLYGAANIKALRRIPLAWEKSILQLILYVDELYLPDLLDLVELEKYHTSFYSLAVHQDIFDLSQAFYNQMKRFYERLEPLEEAGIVKYYNPISTYLDDVAVQLTGTRRFLTRNELNDAWPSLFVLEGVLTAEALGVPYTSITSDEINALRKAEASLRSTLNVEGDLLSALSAIELPGFALDADTIIRARRDNEAHEDFRKILRVASGSMRGSVENNDFQNYANEWNKDILRPAFDELRKSTIKSAVLSKAVVPNVISFSSGLMGSLAIGSELQNAISAGLVTAVGAAILTAFFEKAPKRPAIRFYNHIRMKETPKLFA